MKTRISKQEYDEINEQASAAKELLEDQRFQFYRDYLKEARQSIESSILNNTVREVQESVSITQTIVKTFITPKKQQLDELSGQYKFIEKLENDLHYWVNTQKELHDQIEAGKVQIV